MVIKHHSKPAHFLPSKDPCYLGLNLSISIALKHAYSLPHIPRNLLGGSPH